MMRRTRKQQWSEGVYLLGRYDWFGTGCWLLTSGSDGAIVAMPPYSTQDQESPANKAYHVCKKAGITVRYLLCTHNHSDHFSSRTAHEMQDAFPHAEIHLQRGFEGMVYGLQNVRYLDHEQLLYLGGEPLHLVHAPKHSWTDTMIIFKGVIIAGDWELNTLHSVHDNKPRYRVPTEVKLASIERMQRFQSDYNYQIHKVFSAHANDRREDIDFHLLMEDTKIERVLW